MSPNTETDARPDGAEHGSGVSTTPASKSDIKPSVAWYWIGAVILVLGIVGAFALMIAGIVTLADAPNHYERVSNPGERTVTLNDAGTYHLYGETPDYYSSSYGSSYSYGNTIASPTVTVKDANGTSIQVIAGYPTSSSSYSSNGLRAYDFASFSITSPGSYTVTVTAADRSSSSSRSSYTPSYEVTRVAVGNSVSSTAVPELIGSAALGSIAVLLGIFILIFTAVRRSRSRKELFPPAPRPAPYPFGTPYAAAGAGYRPGYPPPGYPPPGYGQRGYPPPGYPPPGYPPAGYPAPGYAPSGYPGSGYPPGGYQPSGAPSGPPVGRPVEAPSDAGFAPRPSPFEPIGHQEPPVAEVPADMEPPTSAAPDVHPIHDHDAHRPGDPPGADG